MKLVRTQHKGKSEREREVFTLLEVSSQSDLQRIIILFIECCCMTYAQEKEVLTEVNMG